MKRVFFLMYLVCMVISSCSSDDNDNEIRINPSEVFTGKMPTSVSGMTMTYENGLLTKIQTENETVTFSYGTNISLKSTSNNPDNIKITIYDNDYPEEAMYLDMSIGKNGFVEKCVETYADNNDIETWEFKYNSDGYLIYMKRSEGGNEVTNIKYENGNITEVSMRPEDDEDKMDARILYISENTPTAIENKGCIMLFDQTFGIDMDEMKYAYWAGLLGKATKHLPVEIVYSDNENPEDAYSEFFEWTLNSEGYPIKMIWTEDKYTEEFLFNW